MIRQYQENFASSQRVLNEAQKKLEERTERERKAQQDFSAIQQELMKLQSETATIVSLFFLPTLIAAPQRLKVKRYTNLAGHRTTSREFSRHAQEISASSYNT